jgi:hypothetical protein
MPVGEKLYRADNGRDLRFYYDFDALVAVEEAAGRSFKAVLEDMARGETLLKDLRALIWAGLQKHQPEITLSQAGELVLTEGQRLGESMREALVAAMPELKADSPKKRGIGTAETLRRPVAVGRSLRGLVRSGVRAGRLLEAEPATVRDRAAGAGEGRPRPDHHHGAPGRSVRPNETRAEAPGTAEAKGRHAC